MKPSLKLMAEKTMDTQTGSKTHPNLPPPANRKIRVLVLPDDCALDEPYAGWILDRHRDGLRLQLERLTIDVGTVLRLRHPDARPGSPWMLVRVTHRQRRGNEWILSCERLQTARCAG